jgi:hypothetical protein
MNFSRTDFSNTDVPLYPGRLVGLRSFKVDEIGQLTGVSYYNRAWVNGENDAKCGVWDETFFAEMKRVSLWPNTSKAWIPSDHQVAAKWCTCGFYAYFAQEHNVFHEPNQIEGIIEAWGKVTIGLKGFRASKARIVALVIPYKSAPMTWIAKLRHHILCKAPWYAHAWSNPYSRLCSLPNLPCHYKKVISGYPDARIFQTVEDAIEAFPPTPLNVAQEICEMGN